MSKIDRDKKESIDKKDIEDDSRKYAPPALTMRSLDVIEREGFYRKWVRESEMRMAQYMGYTIVPNTDGSQSLYGGRMQDASNTTSCYRTPSKDRNEDLILVEAPIEVRNKELAEQAARTALSAQILEPGKWKDRSGSNWEQSFEQRKGD
jgi:hypothetical protein